MKISDLAFALPTATPVPQPVAAVATGRLEDRIGEVCRGHAARAALVDETGTMTFSALDEFSARIARFLVHAGLRPETPVAVMCSRSRLFVAAALGILRAGAIYVPLDPALPLNRRELILGDCGAPLLITEARLTGEAERLAYACPSLSDLLCLDRELFSDAVERPGELMALELWNHVTADAADGSWKSFFDGQPLAPTVLESLAANLVTKAGARLGPSRRVLDVGSGAGAVARALMSRCGQYTALDLSRRELDRLEQMAGEFPGLQVDVHQLEATDIGLLPASGYDLITLNSVIENFPGYNYLRRVLDQALAALGDEGVILVSGVWDQERKAAFAEDLRRHGEERRDWSGALRLECGAELFVPKSFFSDWAKGHPGCVEVEFSRPAVACPELCDYRFDVMIRRLSAARAAAPPPPRHRHGTAALDAGPNLSILPLPSERAAYIIYTSGTTGRPKGVVVEQGSLLNLAEALLASVYTPRYGSEPLQVALLASFSFDASLQQIVAALLGGHTLHIVDDETRRDPEALHRCLENRRIDLCDGTPSLFSLLTDYWLEHQLCSSVTTFILGGEALRNDHLERFFSISGHRDRRIVNAYGPTECCVDSTLFQFDLGNHRDFGIPPIGYPLANVALSVRGVRGEPLPEGVPGELWISGLGVARGYYRDPELTARRFVTADGIRWYRSGDICRRLADGVFFFTGREDQQVKIGGYRVELGEIEAVLNDCPQVREATVVAADFVGNGVATLASYIVPASHLEPTQIRSYLAMHLPAYAIPTHFVAMAALPVTVSGKIDRKSLPSPVATGMAVPSRPQRAPAGPLETRIAKRWEQLLGRPVDDANSDFFELGGHSVLGIRLISLLEKDFGRRLSLSQLFKRATIADLAALLAEGDAQEAYSPLVPLATETPGTPIFLFHPVGGNVLCYRPLATLLAPGNPVYAVEAPGANGEWPQLPSVEKMAETYLAAILATVPSGPKIFAGWSFGGLVAYECARQFADQGGEVEGLFLFDTAADTRLARQLIQKDEAAMLAVLFSEQLPVTEEDFRSHRGPQRLDYLIRLGIEHGLLPAGFSPEQMKRLLQTFHNNALAAARYVPPKGSGRALLIRPTSESRSALTIADDPLQGWGEIFGDGLELRWMSGNHESMLLPHSAAELAGHIQDFMRWR